MSTIVTAECTNCGGTVKRMLATVERSPDWRDHVLCTACREEVDPTSERIDRKLAAERVELWHARVRSFDAASGYDEASIEGVNAKWADSARRAIDEWLDQSSVTRTGIMFAGPTGIGKTWGAFAVANEAARLGYATSIRASTEADLFGAQVAPWELQKRLERWTRGASVLLVDDIGVAARQHDQIQAGWKQLCDLVSAQPTSMLLIGTSNRQSWTKDDGIVDWIGQQSGSRLRSWMTIATTGVVDRRTGIEHKNWAAQLRG